MSNRSKWRWWHKKTREKAERIWEDSLWWSL